MTLEHPIHQRTAPHAAPDRSKSLEHRRASTIVEAFSSAVSARWGTTKTRRNHTLIGIVDALARLESFADGGRAAYPVEKLAVRLRKNSRTVEEAIAKLREFPELVRVLRIEHGTPNWRGRRSWSLHLEYELGPVLLDAMSSQSPGVTPAHPRSQIALSPGLTPSDPNLDQVLHLELKPNGESTRVSRTDRRNFEVAPSESNSPFHPETGTHQPTPNPLNPPFRGAAKPPTSLFTHHSSPTDSQAPSGSLAPSSPRPSWAEPSAAPPSPAAAPLRPAHGPRPGESRSGVSRRPQQPPLRARAAPLPVVARERQPAPELLHPIDLIEDVIRQHRRIAEGKGPFVPIDDGERALVDGCLQRLTWCSSSNEKLAWCRRVSELASRDAAAQNGRAANLTFTFGGLEGKPQKFFLERGAQLREQDEKLAKELNDGELTSKLLGTRPPVKAAPRPAPNTRRVVAPNRPRRSAEQPLSPAELYANIEALRTSMHQPNVARAG